MELLQQILAVCGGITVIGGAGTVILKIVAPAFKLSKRVKELENHDAADYKRIQGLEEMQRKQSKCLASIANHMIDGNGIETMKKTRDELLESIIEN